MDEASPSIVAVSEKNHYFSSLILALISGILSMISSETSSNHCWNFILSTKFSMLKTLQKSQFLFSIQTIRLSTSNKPAKVGSLDRFIHMVQSHSSFRGFQTKQNYKQHDQKQKQKLIVWKFWLDFKA